VSDVFRKIEQLLLAELIKAWEAGQRGDPTPVQKDANTLAWALLSLPPTAVTT
jgi:hypothetical protein